jgi:hypothetical protein
MRERVWETGSINIEMLIPWFGTIDSMAGLWSLMFILDFRIQTSQMGGTAPKPKEFDNYFLVMTSYQRLSGSFSGKNWHLVELY